MSKIKLVVSTQTLASNLTNIIQSDLLLHDYNNVITVMKCALSCEQD